MGRILDAKRDMDTIATLRAELEAVKAETVKRINDWSERYSKELHRAEAAELRAAQLEAENGRLREAALEATRKCMSAWAAGEPAHRVKDMIDAVERLQSLVDPLHGAALIGREG